MAAAVEVSFLYIIHIRYCFFPPCENLMGVRIHTVGSIGSTCFILSLLIKPATCFSVGYFTA